MLPQNFRIYAALLAVIVSAWAGCADGAPNCSASHYPANLPQPTIQSTNTTALDAPRHLDVIDEDEANADGSDCKYHYIYTGAGVDVYILDDGIIRNAGVLQELPNLQAEEFDGFPNQLIVTGHASSVAAVIGGRNAGVAKNARLYSVRVRNNGTGASSVIADGLDWVINRRLTSKHYVPGVVNMSLDFRTVMDDPGVRQRITQLLDMNVFVVFSTGNNQGSVVGVTDTCEGLAAWVQDSVVGRLYIAGNASTSGIGTSRRAGACADGFAQTASGVYSNSFGGSSAAAPQFAGIAALVLQQFPQMTPEQVHAELNLRSSKNRIPGTAAWPANSNNRLAQSLPVYTQAPSAMTSIAIDSMLCNGEHIVSWTGGGPGASHYELQSSASSGFASPVTRTVEDALLSVYPAADTYYRVRACNGYGCGAFATHLSPATTYNGCAM